MVKFKRTSGVKYVSKHRMLSEVDVYYISEKGERRFMMKAGDVVIEVDYEEIRDLLLREGELIIWRR